jgi:hypothetical protein
MIVNNPDNAGLTPGPGISLKILSNSFSALTAVSFATERLVGAVSERDAIALVVGAAAGIAGLCSVGGAASVAEPSAGGCIARDGVEFRAGVLEDFCRTKLGLDEDGCGLDFPKFLNIEDNFGRMNFRMMIRNKEQEHEASRFRINS